MNLYVAYNASTQHLACTGDWCISTLPSIQATLKKVSWPSSGSILIKADQVAKMDSAGAWLLNETIKQLEQQQLAVSLEGLAKEHADLLAIVASKSQQEAMPKPLTLSRVQQIGKAALVSWQELNEYLSFIGRLSYETLRICRHPKHIRVNAIASTIYKNGYLALPIIALLSFMIGIVITYQMGLQLKNYGANVFIVDLLGLSILREFAPLLTAIMVAGRSGSAFTAQIGMMKINQEIDALNTMGVTPAELLLLPRIFGLLIALPLLTMWANLFGVLGGMIMANNMLSITFYDFLHRFPNVIPLRALFIGLGKTPVFALIIASVGCFQGMRVKENADSVGSNTTRSVVLGIFFIIVADAIFSIIFSKLKL